ncbi:MAG: single-stranded-DNA-specific exonuclease RecJ [Candidatus Promineifilaceae bacterium]
MVRPESIRKKRWLVAPAMPTAAAKQLDHIHPILRQVLYNRGLEDPAHVQAFLEGRYLSSVDPFLLADMDKAVARVGRAIEDDELIVVYGDFDADGVTSTVLLTEALRGLGCERRHVRPYIPDRVDEGYGLNEEAIAAISELGASLMITVDCGIRSIREVAYANELGIDVIVTDHHNLGTRMPEAHAVINPKRVDSEYPDRMLAGVGIAYKLAQALYETYPERAKIAITSLLDLVALGTVADLAPLQDENRVLVEAGLQELNQLQRPGLSALAKVAGLKSGGITAESIGFALGPRINAAGRMDHAYSAARLLAASNEYTARQLADELNALNRRRQQLTAELGERAETLVDPDDFVLIAGDESFQSGLVGLVASRLSENSYRPAIVMEKGESQSRGSCRSIPEFHITKALDELSDILVRYGGHAQAAGFTIENENLACFAERMREIAARDLEGRELVPALEIDAEIPLESVDWALFETLRQLEPTGQGNPAPIFVSRNVEVANHRVVGRDGAHLQLSLIADGGSGNGRILAGIAFRQGAWGAAMPARVDIVYSVSVNEWNGRRTLQLMVMDIRAAD